MCVINKLDLLTNATVVDDAIRFTKQSQDKIIIMSKDEEQMLHCYEVEDPSVVKEILENPTNIENILQKHALS